MNPRFLLAAAAMLALVACDRPRSAAPAADSPAKPAVAGSDVPVLPVSKGDSWTYLVKLTIPADVTSPGAAEVQTRHERTRTYLGRVAAAEGLPETDCFEVTVPGSPAEREFVQIENDRVLMRGSLILRPETTKPMWLEKPIPFVIAGMKPGTAMPEFRTSDGALTRRTEVIAREEIKVPAGAFPCVRLLTTGTDGDLELRRTVWFSFGKGIIREEKTRYRGDKLVFREVQELTAIRKGS